MKRIVLGLFSGISRVSPTTYGAIDDCSRAYRASKRRYLVVQRPLIHTMSTLACSRLKAVMFIQNKNHLISNSTNFFSFGTS